MLVREMAAWRACVEGEQARPGRRAGVHDPGRGEHEREVSKRAGCTSDTAKRRVRAAHGHENAVTDGGAARALRACSASADAMQEHVRT
jgi:hypothetical protein